MKQWQPQPEEISNGDLNGWLALRAPNVALRNWYAMPTMRNVEPTARFGNLLLYHGDFLLPRVTAGIVRFRAIHMLDESGSDKKLVEQYLLKAIALDPNSAIAAIELGNFALGRHETEQALHWYELARKDAAAENPDVLAAVEREIQVVKSAPSGAPPLRNPVKE